MEKNLDKIREFVDEILVSALSEDKKLKELDKTIDPKTYSRTIHLAHTLKEYLHGD
jgi:hypothetical protein